ncbi:hypothetical protein V8C40DRAFT_53713 [Trichoderma camerunense]
MLMLTLLLIVFDSYSYSYSYSHQLPRIRVHPSTVAWLAASLPCKTARHSTANKQEKESQTSFPPGHVFPALDAVSGLTLQPKRTRRANHTVAAQPPRTRHDKPLRAQGIFAFHTSGQKGNDPCAIARGSPGEPGRAFGLAHGPCRPFFCACSFAARRRSLAVVMMTMVTC